MENNTMENVNNNSNISLIVSVVTLLLVVYLTFWGIGQQIRNIEAMKMGGSENYAIYSKILESSGYVNYQKQQIQGMEQALGQQGANPNNNNPNEDNQQAQNNQPSQNDPLAQFPKGTLAKADLEKALGYKYIQGSKDANLVIIEYTDPECPFCVRHTNDKTLSKVAEKYGNKLAHITKVVQGVNHSNTEYKSLAIICAGQLGGNKSYYDMFDKIMSNSIQQSMVAKEKVVDFAKDLGLNQDKFETCIKSDEAKAIYTANRAEAQSVGANGTPGNLIVNTSNGEWRLVAGAYPASEFEKVIDAMLK